MGLGKREANFQRYLQRHFGLELPEGIELFYAGGVRVANTTVRQSSAYGEKGYAACDFGFNPTNAFIQNFGHLAQRNRVLVEEEQAREFAAGRNMAIDLGTTSKQVIVRWGKRVLGLGYYEGTQRKIRNRIPEKARRRIVNELGKAVPG